MTVEDLDARRSSGNEPCPEARAIGRAWSANTIRTDDGWVLVDFRRPHGATEDTAVAWLGLERSLVQLSGASEPSA